MKSGNFLKAFVSVLGLSSILLFSLRFYENTPLLVVRTQPLASAPVVEKLRKPQSIDWAHLAPFPREEKFKAGPKAIPSVIKHYDLSDSDLAGVLKGLEKNAGKRLHLAKHPNYELEVAAFQEDPHVKYKHYLIEAQCTYSSSDRDVTFGVSRPLTGFTSIGVDFKPQSDASTVNMQMHW